MAKDKKPKKVDSLHDKQDIKVVEDSPSNEELGPMTRDECIKEWCAEWERTLGLVIQPLNEEPDVSKVAVEVYKTLIKDAVGLEIWLLEMYAINARHIALVLHGYYREEITPDDLPELEWQIYILYQKVPRQAKTFAVAARTEDEACLKGHTLCEKETGYGGEILTINGIEVPDGVVK